MVDPVNIVDLWKKDTRSKSYIVKLSESLGVTVTREDISGHPGAFEIDGMPWHEWLDLMTEPEDSHFEESRDTRFVAHPPVWPNYIDNR